MVRHTSLAWLRILAAVVPDLAALWLNAFARLRSDILEFPTYVSSCCDDSVAKSGIMCMIGRKIYRRGSLLCFRRRRFLVSTRQIIWNGILELFRLWFRTARIGSSLAVFNYRPSFCVVALGVWFGSWVVYLCKVVLFQLLEITTNDAHTKYVLGSVEFCQFRPKSDSIG